MRHLPLDDSRRTQGQVYQVQVVDSSGRATAFAYLGAEQEALEVGGEPTPKAVIQAVRELPPGTGHFVDAEGRILAPKDLIT